MASKKSTSVENADFNPDEVNTVYGDEDTASAFEDYEDEPAMDADGDDTEDSEVPTGDDNGEGVIDPDPDPDPDPIPDPTPGTDPGTDPGPEDPDDSGESSEEEEAEMTRRDLVKIKESCNATVTGTFIPTRVKSTICRVSKILKDRVVLRQAYSIRKYAVKADDIEILAPAESTD